jgi:hypothetical protein
VVSVFFRDDWIAFRDDKRDDFNPQGVKVLRGEGIIGRMCIPLSKASAGIFQRSGQKAEQEDRSIVSKILEKVLNS